MTKFIILARLMKKTYYGTLPKLMRREAIKLIITEGQELWKIKTRN